MTPEAITALLAEQNIQKVKYAVADIDGVLRGKTISTRKFLGSLTSDFGMCDVVLGWDVNDPVPAAKACAALLSDWFPATTGEVVHVDGGYHAVGA